MYYLKSPPQQVLFRLQSDRSFIFCFFCTLFQAFLKITDIFLHGGGWQRNQRMVNSGEKPQVRLWFRDTRGSVAVNLLPQQFAYPRSAWQIFRVCYLFLQKSEIGQFFSSILGTTLIFLPFDIQKNVFFFWILDKFGPLLLSERGKGFFSLFCYHTIPCSGPSGAIWDVWLDCKSEVKFFSGFRRLFGSKIFRNYFWTMAEILSNSFFNQNPPSLISQLISQGIS